jgi:hypothetical protein
VLGRKVEVEAPVRRVILGEGRQMYFVAALDKDAPFKRVVGWRDDLPKADPDSYKAYLARYPEIAKLPSFGGMKEGAFDIEQAIALKPDVLFLNVEAKIASDEVEPGREACLGRHPRRLCRLPRKALPEHRAVDAAHRQALRQGGDRRGLHQLPRRGDRQGHGPSRQGAEPEEARRDDRARGRVLG